MGTKSIRNPSTISLLTLELVLRFIKLNLNIFGNEWSIKDRVIDLGLEYEIRDLASGVNYWASLEQKKKREREREKWGAFPSKH